MIMDIVPKSDEISEVSDRDICLKSYKVSPRVYSSILTSPDVCGDNQHGDDEVDDVSSDLKAKKIILGLEEFNAKLITENTRLKEELIRTNKKWLLMQSRTQYLQDNYDSFYKLRQEYQEMTQNLVSSQKAVTAANWTQTWDGIVCRSCMETAKLMEHPYMQAMEQIAGNRAVIITKAEIEKLTKSVNELQHQLDIREETFSKRMEINECERLRARKGILESKIRSQARELRAAKENLRILQIIVIKLERNRRAMLENQESDGSDAGSSAKPEDHCCISEEEQYIVRRIVARFVTKAVKKGSKNKVQRSNEIGTSNDALATSATDTAVSSLDEVPSSVICASSESQESVPSPAASDHTYILK